MISELHYFLQLISGQQINITEGGDSETIKFRAMAPPSFFCGLDDTKDNCQIKLKTKTVIERYGDYCVSGKASQLVVGPMAKDGGKSCDIEITNENWDKEFEFSVSAKVDGLMDGDQTREVEVSGIITSGSVSAPEHHFFTVEVNIAFLIPMPKRL